MSISPLCRPLVLVVAVSALVGLAASKAAAHTVDLDCSDFAAQAEAQEHRDRHPGDPDGLDDDEDGTTCEELPCPCGFIALPPAAPEPVRPTPRPLRAALTTKARVVRVIDARTLKVRLFDGGMISVRLIGVVGFTRRGAGSRGACGVQEATARIKRVAFHQDVGRVVEVRTDPMQSREGESEPLLAYVGVRGVDLGHAMIASGWAKVQFEADFERVSTYRRAQASAKAAKRGLWRRCGDSALVR